MKDILIGWVLKPAMLWNFIDTIMFFIEIIIAFCLVWFICFTIDRIYEKIKKMKK